MGLRPPEWLIDQGRAFVSRQNSKALHRIYKSMLEHPDAFVQDLQIGPTDHDNKPTHVNNFPNPRQKAQYSSAARDLDFHRAMLPHPLPNTPQPM